MFQFNSRITTSGLPSWNQVPFSEEIHSQPVLEDLSFLGLSDHVRDPETEKDELDFLCFGASKDFNIVSPLLSRRNSYDDLESALDFTQQSSLFCLPSDQQPSSQEPIMIKKAIKKAKKIPAVSRKVKAKAKTSKKAKTAKVKKRTTKKLGKKSAKKRLIRKESCSTMSRSSRSASLEKALSSDSAAEAELSKTAKMFKLKTRGSVTNIPQIYNTGLFCSTEDMAKEGASDCSQFVNSDMLKKLATTRVSHSGALAGIGSVLQQVRRIKQTNMEASSYMASLEAAIVSIDNIKVAM